MIAAPSTARSNMGNLLSSPGVKKDVRTDDGPEPPARPSDDELVRRCQDGQAGAFEELLDRYQDRIFNLVYRLSGHYQDAQDMTQDVFVKALEHIADFRQQAQFYTWLFRIAVNVAISRRRRGQRVRFVPLDPPASASADGDGQGGGVRLADERAEDPPEAVERDETNRRVAGAIGQLDEEFRGVLVLKDIEGFDYERIGEILELPLGTVKSRLHRARLELKRLLGASR